LIGWQFWEEELRSFPFGGGHAALWVVRRDKGQDPAPLRLLLARTWLCRDDAGAPGRAPEAPPLGRLLRTLQLGRAELVPGPDHGSSKEAGHGSRRRRGEPVLWLEPLVCPGDRVTGAMALRFDRSPPWGEAVRLWGTRFAARLGPCLEELEAWPGEYAGHRGALVRPEQPSLFPAALLERSARPVRCAGTECGVPLPHPLFVPGVPGLVGISRELQTCCAGLPQVARSGVNVLLHGESGTGKEIVAWAIHTNSDRAAGPLVGQNCAALPETLFESELFGHRSGAFTGAVSDKAGLLEAANDGTFFLDEIGDMPLSLQIKLLRVMQERRVRRIGELESRPVNIRFIAATHKDLPAEIAAGRFRLDLYYRLNVVRLAIPSLRQRPEDIAHLLAYFLKRHGGGDGPHRISERALAALQAYRWPGNVRELENEICRFLALCPGQLLIRLRHLSPEVQTAAGWSVDPADLATLRPLEEAGELLERYLIRKAIAACGGHKAAAARRLGLSRQGLYKKIQRYEMSDLIGNRSRP
jgi:transcriptional regulator with AAA-type ATPase domain